MWLNVIYVPSVVELYTCIVRFDSYNSLDYRDKVIDKKFV